MIKQSLKHLVTHINNAYISKVTKYHELYYYTKKLNNGIPVHILKNYIICKCYVYYV